ncbi:hypothetical protein Leryth_007440 [Lithospermum erythrorhizon]|nr:hypothetical protein Leryth_007440 [Lithospermum erythrorhizon]
MTTSSLPPSNTFLEITIISAKHLKNVNWRTGPLKPYCIFWLDSNRRLATKSDDSGSTKPVWNERFALPLNLSPQDSLLTLEIFHSKPSETPKPLIGTVFIQIRDLVNYEKSTMIKCFEVQRPSGRPQGKIMIKLALIDRSVCNYQSALQQSFANCQITPPGCFYYSSAPPPPPSTKEYKGYGFAAASPSPPSATRDYKGDYERYIFSGEAPPPPPPSSARDYKGYSFPAARPPPPPPSSTREFKGYNLSVDSLPSPPRPPLPPHYSTRDDKGYYFPSETPPSFPSQAPPYQYGGGYSDGYSSYYQGYYPQQQAEAVRQSLERQASYGGPGPSAPVDYTSSLDQKRGGSVGVAGALGGLALDEEIKYEEDRITEIEENHALEKEFGNYRVDY